MSKRKQHRPEFKATGIDIDVIGNDESYNLQLRTADVVRPWQSYRQSFVVAPEGRALQLPFIEFEPHRTDTALDLSMLRRIGFVAI